MAVKEELFAEAALPNPAASKWIEEGNSAIGTICCHVPEEIIHAAGLMPIRVRATGATDNSQGKALMSTYTCSYAYTTLQKLLDGTYGFLDGIVASDGCLMAERIFDNWRYKGNSKDKVVKLVNVPRKVEADSLEWLVEEYRKMKKAIEDFTGKEITDDDLRASFEVYNETRRLIRELYSLQKDGKVYIKGSEIMKVIMAGMSMPKEEYNKKLAALIDELKAAGPIESDNVRVVFIGSALDNPEYLETIEECGVDVVMDMQCFGSRYLWEPVEMEGDPLVNLAELHLHRPTCPRMVDSYDRLYEFARDAVREYDAQGVIQVNMRYCDLWNGARIIFTKKFAEDKIPLLMLEREEITTNAGQLAVRVEAFVEMLEEEE